MKSDLYTKIILTIIAGLLVVSVVQTSIQKPVTTVVNQPAVSTNSPMAVDIVKVNGQKIYADYSDMGISQRGIPVTITK